MNDHPIAALFPLLEGNELNELVLSMRTHGYDSRHPILLHEGKILDGRNRYRAALAAEVKPVTLEWTGGDPWDFVWRENATRRHLEPGQKAAIHLKFVTGSSEWQAEQVARREKANKARAVAAAGNQNAVAAQRAAERTSPPTSIKNSPVSRDTAPFRAASPPVSVVRARDAGAAAAGVSPATYARAIALQKENPKAFERVIQGEEKLNRALAETKKAAVISEIKSRPMPMPSGRHHVIVIDPPWRYDTRAENSNVRGTVEYPDMSIAEICAVPVGELSEANSVLWLWTTNAFMRDAFTCLDAWGFKEKTILTWDKERIGVGHWLRNVTEHCVVAVKGSPVVTLTNQSTILRVPRREHSRKPDEFYAMVETLCTGSKLEIFAREPRDGWNSWGAEATKFARPA